MANENDGTVNNITVLYEDENVLVINKPSGLIVHNDGRSEGETVASWFLARCPEAATVGEPQTLQNGDTIIRPGIVHRLDRETSGVMILAKTQEAFVHLKTQFHDRLAQKEYRAFVYGTMKEKWGTIDRKIGRSANDRRLRSAQRGAHGKLRPAITNWELIGQSDTHAYLKLFPKTGRTHQIRVHMKAADRPIVADRLYAPQSLRGAGDLGLTRLALHAHKLRIVLPSGEEQEFIAPLPQMFEDAAEKVIEGMKE